MDGLYIKNFYEEVLFDKPSKIYFPKCIEILLFSYYYFFRQNPVEKTIIFSKNENINTYDILTHQKLIFKDNIELYYDNNSLDNKLFAHFTHKNKIKKSDINNLERYFLYFKDYIFSSYISLDKFCEFAISFSFNYKMDKLYHDNIDAYYFEIKKTN